MLSRSLAVFFQQCRSFVHAIRHVPTLEASSSDVAAALSRDIDLYEDFITEEEEASMLAEVEPYLQKLHYEFDHWDDAIHGFRETERRQWSRENSAVLARIQRFAFPEGVKPLELVHVLDLAAKGHIKPHVDSVRFCGSVIAGLSLLSNSVMKFEKEGDTEQWAKVLIPARSLYIQRGIARYDYTHAILEDAESFIFGRHVPRSRRISVMCRNEP